MKDGVRDGSTVSEDVLKHNTGSDCYGDLLWTRSVQSEFRSCSVPMMPSVAMEMDTCCIGNSGVFHLLPHGDGWNGVRATERKVRKSTRLVLRRRNLVEEETSRRSAWKVDAHVGRCCVLGHQDNHRRSHRGELEWCAAHKNSAEEDSERKLATKQPGDDRGASMVQERRR